MKHLRNWPFGWFCLGWLVGACLFLGACDKTLTNEEVIKGVKICRDAGLSAVVVRGVTNYGAPVSVYCLP